MSTLHKVKAYFGMAPMDDYDDEYYDDEDRPSRAYPPPRALRRRGIRPLRRPTASTTTKTCRVHTAAATPTTGASGPREFDRPAPRFGSLRGSTRGALAMDPRRMAMLFDEGSPLSKITTLRPKDYSEARTIGERFRDGTPVIMDLVTMDNADAKRLVDFAAGLAFALRGSFDKVATKVFLLSPADVDVTADDRRRIAETGFYAYQ